MIIGKGGEIVNILDRLRGKKAEIESKLAERADKQYESDLAELGKLKEKKKRQKVKDEVKQLRRETGLLGRISANMEEGKDKRIKFQKKELESLKLQGRIEKERSKLGQGDNPFGGTSPFGATPFDADFLGDSKKKKERGSPFI
jgi:hypothetical protein